MSKCVIVLNLITNRCIHEVIKFNSWDEVYVMRLREIKQSLVRGLNILGIS